MLSAIDQARDKAKTFSQEGSSGDGANADQFLAANARSVKQAGAQETDFWGPSQNATDPDSPAPSLNASNERNPGTDQDTQEKDIGYDVPSQSATDPDAPPPSMNAKNEADPGPGSGGGNGMSWKDIDIDWETTTNAGNERKLGGKKGKYGIFGDSDLQNLRDQGYNDKQITKYLDKNVGYGQIKGGVRKDLDYQYKGDKIALEDYDWENSGNNNSFGTGNLAELKAMGYSDKEIDNYMKDIAGKKNQNIGDIGGSVQRRTGFGVSTDLTADNIGDYKADEIGRSWQEDTGKDHYGREEMRALAQHNEGLSKEDVANEFLKRQAESLKEGYEGNPFKTNRKGQEWMDRYGTYDPDNPGEGDPGPDDPTDPDPTEPTPDPTDPDPTEPTPDPTEPTPAPTPAPVPTNPTPSPNPSAPPYQYVPGNPYSKDNPGYYYGTDHQERTENRNHIISDNAANAHANGLADIEVWQKHAHERQENYGSIMNELYKKMGLMK